MTNGNFADSNDFLNSFSLLWKQFVLSINGYVISCTTKFQFAKPLAICLVSVTLVEWCTRGSCVSSGDSCQACNIEIYGLGVKLLK